MDVCKLPNKGLNPGAISDDVISDDQLSECFRTFKKNGVLLSACNSILHEDIIHLTQVLDGFEVPINSMVGKSLAKRLYAHLILGKAMNWAGFAKGKHKNQVSKAWRGLKQRPNGPPIVQVDRVYNSPRVNASLVESSIAEEEHVTRSLY